ncbi:hypothetical protein [Congregibacter sp.]
MKPGRPGTAIANQLRGLGFRQRQPTALKQKPLKALVDHWLEEIPPLAP